MYFCWEIGHWGMNHVPLSPVLALHLHHRLSDFLLSLLSIPCSVEYQHTKCLNLATLLASLKLSHAACGG